MWYVVQFKGHYTTDWTTYWAPIPNSAEFEDLIRQSQGAYTTISVPIKNDAKLGGTRTNFPEGGAVEFRVCAEKGTYETTANAFQGITTQFNGEVGDWSNTQTITIPNVSASTTPNPLASTTPYAPTIAPPLNSNGSTQVIIQISFGNLLLMAGVVVIVVVAVVIGTLLFMRHRTPYPKR